MATPTGPIDPKILKAILKARDTFDAATVPMTGRKIWPPATHPLFEKVYGPLPKR